MFSKCGLFFLVLVGCRSFPTDSEEDVILMPNEFEDMKSSETIEEKEKLTISTNSKSPKTL